MVKPLVQERMLSGAAVSLLSLVRKHELKRTAIQQLHSHLIFASVHADCTSTPIVLTLWNSVLRHYSLGSFPQEALFLFQHLQRILRPGFFFDSFAYSFLIKAAANLTQPSIGKQNVFDEMPSRNSVTWNVLITGLIKWGELGFARAVFNAMPEKNVVSWTGIIDGYTRTGKFNEALLLFREMAVSEGIKPSEVTLLTIFPAVWNLGHLKSCQMLHAYGEKSGINSFDIRVMNSLVDAYSKCGSINYASKAFDDISDERRNLVSWTSIISGFAMHGMAKEASNGFRMMQNANVKPNQITFLSVLHGCSHGGLVDEGVEFFGKMVHDFGLQPNIKHYGSLIDMLGRAGRLEEAERMALEIPNEISNNVVIWRTLLGACSFHGNAELGQRVMQKILEVERTYGGDYVLLSNIFVDNGRYIDSEEVRRLMDEENAQKVPAFSFA
ncbi:PREDICTED: pentatricopeptide repeat-containing protein At1g09220, mitochondrial isoform X2 [Ipomoea nil]|uniref:pentatricopeptide repeat-containing protein At1g09220, mitochondrial isoform X2 n=1 Tax=Ipomoea nil TaxID=35883 RepID=UPI0009018425|nr:PREDICTED: pentatricopeptide repeat-containing protein At1g09220, mitochondrial isoform X2 [Ipomoea nil]